MYIAIDGGGTKTEYLLLNQTFEIVDRSLGGATNHERLQDGYDGVLRAFEAGILPMLERNGLRPGDIRDVVAGLAGADNGAQVARLEGLLSRMGFGRVLVCNDGYLPVMAECAGGVGIAYNCGTGVCCTAIDSLGKMTKIGGLDEWTDDAGGGVWMLQQAFKSVYDDVILGAEHTALSDSYAQILGAPLETLAGMLDETLPAVKENADVQKRLIAAVFQAYEAGDAAAQRICAKMIARAADYIGAAYRLSSFGGEQVQVILSGSILLRAAPQRYLSALRAAVAGRIPAGIEWLAPQQTAAYGAAAFIRQRRR